MNNLLFRSLAIGIVSIISFAAVAIAVISLGLRGTLDSWETSNNQLLVQTVSEKLLTIAQNPGADTLDQLQLTGLIKDKLQALPVRPEYIVVLNQQDQIVFLNHLGDNPPGGGFNLLRKLMLTADWHDIPSSGQPWIRFAARVLPFDADESNRLLFSAMGMTVIWGAVAASLIAFLLAYLLSRPLSRQARALAVSLEAMQKGRRDMLLPAGGVKELALIAQSAQALQNSLHKEESTRQQWAADIAHDLRTPLTALKGQFEGMIDGVFQPDRPRLERNYQEILHLEHLINQLTELTKLETPGFRLDRRMLDAGELLRALANRFADQAQAKGCLVEVAADLTQPCLVHADHLLLERALSNLIDNALRYGLPQNRIILSPACDQAGMVIISVENTGTIPAAQLPFLFDRLYRSDQSRNTPGSGLGLAIVKAIALAHQGTVTVDCNETTQRTRFSLHLPK